MGTRQMTPFFHPLFLFYYFKINPSFSAVLSFLKIISTLRPGLTFHHGSRKISNLVLRLLQIHLWVKKLSLFIFTHTPKQKSTTGFYHYPPGRRELPIHPKMCFLKIFFLRRKGGEDYQVEKNTKLSKGIGHKFG